jgi:CRISPR-associated endonuclease/helicase Cas3
MKYWAHSDPTGLPPEHPGACWQPLAEHLQNVAALARQIAVLANPSHQHFHDLAERAGLLHDFGKYTTCFQEMIRGKTLKCPHAIHGAVMAFWGSATDPVGLRSPHIAAAIAGHHAGMPDLKTFRDKVKENLVASKELLAVAAADLPAIDGLVNGPAPALENLGPRFDLLTRMLLSCLVDADRLDTAGREFMQAPLNAPERLNLLMAHLRTLSGGSHVVKEARREVLQNCLEAASSQEQIFSLSVPTGGGKTLSAMAFALKRAALFPERFRRVIVVIPYLSIIEQNAEVYAKIFGADSILEHHSGFLKPAEDLAGSYQPPARRPETENWDAPLIVTTSVRFFESLFSNHPSDLRRVHNIARSIVILDEVQVLPRELLAPLLGIMDELTKHWGCSFVLSTATKPAFERPANSASPDPRWPSGTVREIIHQPAELHKRLRRVSIDWRIKQPVDWPEVAGWMQQHEQALCVVNVREHAARLYDELFALVSDSGLYHLSTRMCPAHRLRVIAEIRSRLLDGLPCRVVSTQLIEAGVDLDFPVAFRALGPLDSIVQVAGRADREGKLTASAGKPAGLLVVFKPFDHKTPPNEYKQATEIAEVLALISDIQPDDLASMTRFYEAHYSHSDLGSKFLTWRKDASFKTLAEEFEMISSRTHDVYVPYGEGKNLIDDLYRVRQLFPDLRRRLQRYTVGLQPWEFSKAKNTIASELAPESDVWIAGDSAYTEKKGLILAAQDDPLIA